MKRFKSAPKERLYHLDVVCGILIVYMILYHCSQWAHVTDYDWAVIAGRIFFFFMPWFFFKAGMFLNPEKKIKEVIGSSFKRLVVPFIKYTLLGYIFYCLVKYVDGDASKYVFFVQPIKDLLLMGACSCNLPLWFLLTLFVVRVITYLGAREKVYLVLLVIMTGVGAVSLHYLEYEKPVYVANICSGCFFFIMGYMLKTTQFSRIFFVIASILYLATLFFPSAVDMFPNKLMHGEYFLWLVGSIAGCILFNNVFAFLKNGRLKIFAFVGRNSMLFYCFHWVILTIANLIKKLSAIEMSGQALFFYYLGSITVFFVIFFSVRHGITKRNVNG